MFIEPVLTRLKGELQAPPDKSISHRAALLAAMCAEPVRIYNYLQAEDTNSTLLAVQILGAMVNHQNDGSMLIRGVGLAGIQEVTRPIDVGNAGTLMRLLPGWLASQTGVRCILDGDASIRRRPVDRIVHPLSQMGARIFAKESHYPPLEIIGHPLKGINYELNLASAQVKSCILLAGLNATGTTTVTEPNPCRDHTERMLFGAGVSVNRQGGSVSITATDELLLEEIRIPGDLSSAAFFITAALLIPGSKLVIRNVGVNWTRAGFLHILERMGAKVKGELEPIGAPLSGGEPVSDIEVKSSQLVGTVIEPEEVGLAIDELPLIALLGCFAQGETIVRGAEELRVKESDRITGVVEGLRGIGATIEASADGFVVSGGGSLRGGSFNAHGDHRLAMLGAIAGLVSRQGVEVVGMESAAVSYPGFVDDIAYLVK